MAIVWPGGRGPLLIAAYLTETDANAALRNDTLARVGSAVAMWTVRR